MSTKADNQKKLQDQIKPKISNNNQHIGLKQEKKSKRTKKSDTNKGYEANLQK